MYRISQKMPLMELKTFTKFVAAVFCVSCATAFSFSLLRLVKPDYFYLEPLEGTNTVVHYIASGLLVVSSAIGFINSSVTLHRPSSENCGRNITRWLLLDSVFETSRIVYMFLSEVLLKGQGEMRLYELIISCGQYLLDSCLYCQMILRH